MIKLFVLFFLPISVFGAKILSYNVYDRTDRVDVMITFDTPYVGQIKKSLGNSVITIKLEDASIESRKTKELTSEYLRSLTITPMPKYTKIVAIVPDSVMLQASKTSDAYGLRLRFTTKVLERKKRPTTKTLLSSLPTKKDDDISKSYFIVVGILIVGIILLWYIKRKVTPSQAQRSPWLFKETVNDKQPATQPKNHENNVSDVNIKFQKSLDTQNSVVLLEFANQSYLVLVGKNNLLLDKFIDNKPATKDEFETILQNRHKELDDFLNSNEETSFNTAKEPLQAYKERAAISAYET